MEGEEDEYVGDTVIAVRHVPAEVRALSPAATRAAAHRRRLRLLQLTARDLEAWLRVGLLHEDVVLKRVRGEMVVCQKKLDSIVSRLDELPFRCALRGWRAERWLYANAGAARPRTKTSRRRSASAKRCARSPQPRA